MYLFPNYAPALYVSSEDGCTGLEGGHHGTIRKISGGERVYSRAQCLLLTFLWRLEAARWP